MLSPGDGDRVLGLKPDPNPAKEDPWALDIRDARTAAQQTMIDLRSLQVLKAWIGSPFQFRWSSTGAHVMLLA